MMLRASRLRRTVAALVIAATLSLPGGSAIAQAPIGASQFVHPWRFRAEMGVDGVAAGWQLSDADDRSWAVVDFFRPWTEHGVPASETAAWYRGVALAPAAWRQASIVVKLRQVGDVELWINGQPIPGRHVDRESDLNRFAAFDLGEAFVSGAENLIAMRVSVPPDGPGGAGTVRIGPGLTALLTPREYTRLRSQDRPEWLMPSWAEDRATVWTSLGVPGAARRALLDGGGAISPRNPGPTITPWLYDHGTGRLFAPDSSGDLSWRQHGGHLPVLYGRWSAGPAEVDATYFVERAAAPLGPYDAAISSPIDGIARYRLGVSNRGAAPIDLTLYFAVRPYDVRGGIAPIRSIAMHDDLRAIVVNDRLLAVLDRRPTGFGASTLRSADISAFTLEGRLPPSTEALDGDGWAMGAASLRMRIDPGDSEIVTAALPLEDDVPATAAMALALAPEQFERARAATIRAWQDELYLPRIEIPDVALRDGFYASLATLLSSRVGDRYHPGPLEHNAFWTRDAAYLSYALSRTGHLERVRPMLRELVRAQRPDGEFPPVIERDGSVRPVKEWDSQGQGIFMLVRHYRFTGDRAFLEQSRDAILRAVGFLNRLVDGRSGQPVPFRGLLPPSLSAEDIGSADWHHYWDDFWALAGYGEAAFALDELGDAAVAAELRSRRDRLAADLMTSIDYVRSAKSQPQVPNGPEDHGSSSDARGTTAALWPIEVLPGERELLRSSFSFYYQRYVAPNQGAFKHNLDLYWPYAGLGLAQAYLRLEMRDELWQILRWTLEHPSFPGLVVWAEGVHPTGGFGIGDMPHAWAAAEMVNLTRDMLVREDGERLILAGGVPLEWLRDGRRIAIDVAPTYHGLAGFELIGRLAGSGADAVGTLRVRRLGTAAPPAGYRLALPTSAPPTSLVVDGIAVSVTGQGYIDLPSSFGAAVVSFGGANQLAGAVTSETIRPGT